MGETYIEGVSKPENSNEIFRYFISCGLDFIVRMMQKRYLMYKGVRTNILLLAAKCHTPHTSVVAFNANGEIRPRRRRRVA